MGDEDSIELFQQILDGKMEQYMQDCGRTFEEVKASSKIIYNPLEVKRFGNKYNIDFCTTDENVDDQDLIFFNSLVTEELNLRRLPINGNLMTRRNRLMPYLMLEQKLALLKEGISRTSEGKESALILIKQAIPCIMHLENRVGEKLITILLHLGATKFQNERHVVSLNDYMQRIQNIVQRQILGSFLRPKQWRFPTRNEGKEVRKF